MVVRYIGMDIHRDFAQIAMVEDGVISDVGRVDCRPEALRTWISGSCSEYLLAPFNQKPSELDYLSN